MERHRRSFLRQLDRWIGPRASWPLASAGFAGATSDLGEAGWSTPKACDNRRKGGEAPLRVLSATHRERHVQRHRPALEQHREPVAFLGLASDLLVVRGAPDPVAVDLADHVPALDAR